MDNDLTGGVVVKSDLTGWARNDLTGCVVVVVAAVVVVVVVVVV